MKAVVAQYIAREAVRRYGPIEPRLPEKLQRNIRRNFRVTVPREEILPQSSEGPVRRSRRCPDTGFIAALRERYGKESKAILDIVAWYTVHYEYLR